MEDDIPLGNISIFEMNLNETQPASSGGGSAPVTSTPLYIYVTVTVFYGLIFVLGVVGNAMVVYIVLRNRDMRNATNVFLLNLSVADLLVVLICMPSALAEFYGKDVWYLGPFMCRLVPFLENTAGHASCITILAISVERYYAICRPFEVRQVCTFTGTAKVAVALWLLASLCTIPFTIMSYVDKARFYDGSWVDVCRTHIQFPWQQAYIIFILVLFFVIPLFVLICVYGLICNKLIVQSNDPKISDNPRSKSTLRSRRQVVIMLVIVATLFFVCLLPFKVVSLWLIYAPKEDVVSLGIEGYYNLISFARIMHYINSSINPVVYNLVSTRFRNYFRKSLCCTNQREADGHYKYYASKRGTWNNQSCDYSVTSRHTKTSMVSMTNGDMSEGLALTLADKEMTYV